MNFFGKLSYGLKTDVIGKAALRYQRLKSEKKMRREPQNPNSYFGPPLKSIPHLKELISSHYLQGRYANLYKKVAWVTSGAPVEFLKALGFFTLYPENHAAICGVRRKAVDLSISAENSGYSRDLCSYARSDIGSMISGDTPVGRLPRPDLLICCTNICQTVLYWYRVIADFYKAPLIIIDTPFIYSEVTEYAVEYVKKQIEYAIETAERITGRSLDDKEFRAAGARAKEAILLWNKILRCCENRPSPISAFDQFFLMAPIVDMRGEQATVDFYESVLDEIKLRVSNGVGAVKNERKRILWDNLPIWFHVKKLSEMFAENEYSIVASTYTNAWAELGHMIDVNSLLESSARTYLHVILNRTAGHKLGIMKNLIKDFSIDGVILHSDRSCKPYSIGQIGQRDKLINKYGIPAFLLEADHNDTRSFSKEQANNRIAAFMEIVDGG